MKPGHGLVEQGLMVTGERDKHHDRYTRNEPAHYRTIITIPVVFNCVLTCFLTPGYVFHR